MHSQQMENFAHTCHAGNGRWLDMWRTSHFSPTTKSQTSCGGLQQCIHIIIKAYAYNEECSLEILDMLNGFKTLLTKPKCYSCLPSHSSLPLSLQFWALALGVNTWLTVSRGAHKADEGDVWGAPRLQGDGMHPEVLQHVKDRLEPEMLHATLAVLIQRKAQVLYSG